MILTMQRNRTFVLLLALAGLAACGPLVQVGGNTPAPESLLTLRATGEAPPDLPATKATLAISTPSVPGALQTLRLPVLTTDTEIAYLKGATWVEQPSHLFGRLLADTISKRTGITVLVARQLDAGADRQLAGQLLDFGLDVRNPAAPMVRVRYDATLISRTGKLIAARRFDASAPVGSQSPAMVGAALNRAANTAAADVTAWVAAN